jgi:hypothetical protein
VFALHQREARSPDPLKLQLLQMRLLESLHR